MKVSDFMLNLVQQLVKEKSVAESTAAAYVKALFLLNGKDAFKSLTFLKKTTDIDALITAYAQNTQKNLYSAITSVLSLYKDKPTYKKTYAYYQSKMMDKSNEMKAAPPNEKSETQKEEWIDWKDVVAIHQEQQKKVDEFVGQKAITSAQWNTLLNSTILALYTELQPRRNQDYLDMYVVRKVNEEMPKDKNYLVLDGNKPTKFIFNKFKTSKSYGQQVIDIPQSLQLILSRYLKHHPLNKGNKKATPEFKLLVSYDGTPLTAVNSITRVLNKLFGKRVGSSMLRHSFLTGKYGDTLEEQKEDSAAMGHSLNQQRDYIKKED